ncbi:MAG: type II toxin-antitoxin system VapC family toxin [Candidatus Omnitrophica bacterium]|nr:type II toxin-antitoxin system VapC family toxin [Candidatus Omnitrophota bacterium]
MRVYIETTIPSYLVARPARNIVQAARQKLTRDWWRLQRSKHILFTSQIALDEAAQGDPSTAARRLEKLSGMELLELNEETEALTLDLLKEGALPATADRDAAHIAVASVNGMDILLSWNFRHIVNATIQPALRRVVGEAGFTLPVICTPEELMEEIYEQGNQT